MDRKWAARLAAAALLAGLTGAPSFMAEGANYTGNDNNGRLTVSNTVEGSVGGWYRVSGDAANGSVTAENKTKIINGNIFGGYTHEGNASGNTAALIGTWVKGGPDGDYSTGAVFGGYTDRGNAKGNTLTINEYSTIDFQAVGGQTYDGSADNNEVRIDTSFIGRDPRDLSEEEVAQAPDAVNGGSGDSASDNKVEMTDSMSWGRVHGGLYGGLTESGNVTGNSVTVTNVILDGRNLTDVGNGTDAIYGGRTENGDASGNTVTVENSVIYDRGYGGWSESGSVLDNDVVISGGTTEAVRVYGGRSEEGTVAGNGVEISGADTVVTASAIVGGWSESGSVLDNDGTISGGNVTGGFDSEGNVTEADYVYGGQSKEGDVSCNWVSMINGTVGAYLLYGGVTESGSVSDNQVTVVGEKVTTLALYGGWVSKEGTLPAMR